MCQKSARPAVASSSCSTVGWGPGTGDEFGLVERIAGLGDRHAVALTVNTRPRKTLGRKTPAEALDGLLCLTGHGSVATRPVTVHED